ncbi:response regulator receiver domain-containing protein [Spirosoma oryzae]|uniref:Response regulator receiver domain-containing protein n=1 Tax=Spirosoma oryzae TaxID=1469603 RepID=A0A2T0TNQ2_9BACT|nr:response regulator [Spirosoma oryzae]PRY47354.1 response regulator receiver domain-containing protein [Spirosoma oryzae]
MNDLLIYLVDDDEDDRLLLRQAFQQHTTPCRIDEFTDGVGIIDRLTQTTTGAYPNLILLDLNMPRMDGFATLKVIKENNAWQTIPVVVLTTSDDMRDRQRTARLGADDYLVKPPSYSQLRLIIDRGVAIARQDADTNNASQC